MICQCKVAITQITLGYLYIQKLPIRQGDLKIEIANMYKAENGVFLVSNMGDLDITNPRSRSQQEMSL